MNKVIVSLIASLICLAFIGLAIMFGYSRYKAAQAKDEAFRAAMQRAQSSESGAGTLTKALTGQDGGAPVGVKMPGQLGRSEAEAAPTGK